MLYSFIDSKDGYLNYWSNLASTCIPFFALHLYEIIRHHDTLETFANPKEIMKAGGALNKLNKDCTTTPLEKMVNFSKFREIYLILSELEKYRNLKFESKFHICRESLYEMVQHVRTTADYKVCVEETASTFRRSV